MNEAFLKLSDLSIGEILGKPLVSVFGRTSPLAPMLQTPMECFGSSVDGNITVTLNASVSASVPCVMDIKPIMSKEDSDRESSLTHYQVTVAPN